MRKTENRAFTIIEILVVVAIIAILASFLMVALTGSTDAAKTAKVNVKLKEISQWMSLWSGERDNRILPSQFDYNDEFASGTSISYRRDEHAEDDNPNDEFTRSQYQGTWADIIWTDNQLYQAYGLDDREEDGDHLLWESDSPDNDIYEVYDSFEHPFRSTFENTRGEELGLPGYFAANDFFDSRSDNDSDGETSSNVDRYYTYAMMNAPSRSVYLVDSILGETIGDEEEPWDVRINDGTGPIASDDFATTGEVDFRYSGDCLMLMLDGSMLRVGAWSERGPNEDPVEGVDSTLFGQGIRIHQLTRRKPTP